MRTAPVQPDVDIYTLSVLQELAEKLGLCIPINELKDLYTSLCGNMESIRQDMEGRRLISW